MNDSNKIFIRVYKDAYSNGLVAALGADLWITLETIALHMNEQGECWPTQQQIAELIGITRQAANRRVQKLLAFRWNGDPVLEVRKVRGNRTHSNAVYRVTPACQIAIFGGTVSSYADNCERSERAMSPTMSRSEQHSATLAIQDVSSYADNKNIQEQYPDKNNQTKQEKTQEGTEKEDKERDNFSNRDKGRVKDKEKNNHSSALSAALDSEPLPTLAHVCVLATRGCKLTKNLESCNALCFPYLKVHGPDGNGGLMRTTGVPEAYRNVTAQTLPFQRDNPEAYSIVMDYIENIVENVKNGKGLYLYSRMTGTGKTTAAAAIVNEYVPIRAVLHFKNEQGQDITRREDRIALFVNASTFQNKYTAQFRGSDATKAAAGSEYEYLKSRMLGADLLVIDDIGIRNASDGFKGEIYEIIDTRMNWKKATIYTSNVGVEELGKLYDLRVQSRVGGMTETITFKGMDKRASA